MRPEQTACPELGSKIAIRDREENRMKRTLVIGLALLASMLGLTASASARLGMAPMANQDDTVIQVRGGHGHGGGHMGHHGGRGHHYGWGRGRGHHYGWRHR
jgi:Spy/CpxP family protein refolding chaperone